MAQQKYLLCMLFCTVCALSACGANEAQPHATQSASSAAVRVVVTFKQAQRFADTTFLETLQQHTDARFSYVGAVSALTHTYRMEPVPPQNIESALAALQRWTAVQNVAQDEKERN